MAFVLLMTITSCSTTVHLVLTTDDNVDHNATVQIKDKHSVVQKEINTGVINAKSDKNISFKAKKDDCIQIKSAYKSVNGLIYKSSDITVKEIPNPDNYTVELTSDFEFLNDTQAEEMLNASLNNIGGNLSVNPMDIDEAFEKYMGSLIVVIKDPVTQKDTILHRIPYTKLGVREAIPDAIKWKDTYEEGSTNFSGSTANELNEKYPLMAKFGESYNNENVYQFSWQMKGFGIYTKPENRDITPSEMIMQLFFNDIEKIKIAIEEKGARVYYINQAIILKEANLEVREGNSISKPQEEFVDVISGDKAFSFISGEEKSLSYNNQVLTFWGTEYIFNFDNRKVYTGRRRSIFYQIQYSIRNLNRGDEFSPDIFLHEPAVSSIR